MEQKRVSFRCDEDTYGKLESLKALQGLKRDNVLVYAINARFKEVIASIATKEGLVESTPIIELKRPLFGENTSDSSFDEICDILNLKADDGSVSSIKTIKLEIKKASIENG